MGGKIMPLNHPNMKKCQKKEWQYVFHVMN